MVITFASADPPSCNKYITEVDQTGKLRNVLILQCSLLRTKVMVSVKEPKRNGCRFMLIFLFGCEV